MIRILYTASTLQKSGPINQLCNLVLNQDRNLFYPMVCTLSDEPSDSNIGKFLDKNIQVRSLALTRLQGLFYAKQRLTALIDEFKPDIIHSHGFRADCISSKLDFIPRRVSTQQNYPYHDYPMKFGILKGYAMAWLHYRAFQKIPIVIACSESISILNKQHDLHTDFIRNGVNTKDYKMCEPTEVLRLKSRLDVKGANKVFITVGSLIPRKAAADIIQAFMDAENRNNNVLLVCGEGPDGQALRDLAKNHQNIRFLGQVSNVSDYLAVSDCFISASKSEGLPNTVIEAMACGLPVILSDIAPHKEILSINSNAGDTFRLGNIQELRILIENFNMCARAVQASLSIVRESLSAEAMAKSYEQLYLKTIAQ